MTAPQNIVFSIFLLNSFNFLSPYNLIPSPHHLRCIFPNITDNILHICFRPNVEELKNHLEDLGANFVVTEEDLKSSEMKETMKVSLV